MRGAGGEGDWLERKFNLSHPSKPNINLSLDSISPWEAARPSDVFLHFQIWAGSEEARNHVKKPRHLSISRAVLQNKRYVWAGLQELLPI